MRRTGGTAAEREFGDYVAARLPALLRFAHLLCGDPARAHDLVEDGLASAYRHWRTARRSADAYVRRAVLRSYLGRRREASAAAGTVPRRGTGGAPGWASLGDLPPRQRAVLLLREVEQLSEFETAELVGIAPRRAHAAYLAAATSLRERAPDYRLADLPEEIATTGRPDRDASGWSADPLEAVRRRASRQQRRLLVRAGAALGALALALAVPLSIRYVQHRAHDPLSVPVARGLLDWPTRGALAHDGGFLGTVQQVWRTGAAGAGGEPPTSDVRALYAGRLGTGRFAVLEGLDAGRTPWVAVVAEHGPDEATTMTLDAVGRLPAVPPPVLVLGYDGNLNVPWLEPAPPSAYYQALVSPRVTRLEQRVLGLKRPDPYPPGFRVLELQDGLSQSWLSVPAGTRGALRAYRRDRLIFEGVMPLRDPVPQPVTVTVVPPPMPASGQRVGGEQQHLDGLLFAERLGGCSVEVSTVWAGLLPDGVPARQLAARCGSHYASALAVGRDARSELVDFSLMRLGLRGIDVVAGRAPPSRRTREAAVVAIARDPDTRLELLSSGRLAASSRTGVLVASVPPPSGRCRCPDAELRAYDPAGRRLSVGGGLT